MFHSLTVLSAAAVANCLASGLSRHFKMGLPNDRHTHRCCWDNDSASEKQAEMSSGQPWPASQAGLAQAQQPSWKGWGNMWQQGHEVARTCMRSELVVRLEVGGGLAQHAPHIAHACARMFSCTFRKAS